MRRRGNEELDRGYNSLYDLQFQDAQRHFSLWRMDHPERPSWPQCRQPVAISFRNSTASACWRANSSRHDERFNARRKLSPDARLKKLFDQEQSEAGRLAGAALARNPRDVNALLSEDSDVRLIG